MTLDTNFINPPVTESTLPFRLVATKDGVPWDLTGGTVDLYLLPPRSDIPIVKSATIATNVADVVTTISDIAIAGNWCRWWNVIDSGGHTRRTKQVKFNVYDVLDGS